MADWFNRLLVTMLPVVPRPLVRAISSAYVAGETTDDMLAAVRDLNAIGACCTVDLLGEFISHIDQAHETARAYQQVIRTLQQQQVNATISIKLTALGLLIDPDVCFELTRSVVATAQECGNFVRLDMEDTQCTTPTIALYLRLRKEFSNVGIVLQAYLRRTLGDVRFLCEQSAGNFRLCKGIYVEPRELAFQDGAITNKNFVLILEEMIKQGAFVGIATHDESLVWEALRLLDQYQVPPHKYEFQMLLGVDNQMRDMILAGGHPLRVYVPFGEQWYAYSSRRLKENPAIAGHVFKALLRRLFPKKQSRLSQASAEHVMVAKGGVSSPLMAEEERPKEPEAEGNLPI